MTGYKTCLKFERDAGREGRGGWEGMRGESKEGEGENMYEVLGYSVNTIFFLLLVSVFFGG